MDSAQGDRRKELQDLLNDMKCWSCNAVPGAAGLRSRRYNCFGSSHMVCETCAGKRCPSPCGENINQARTIQAFELITKTLPNCSWTMPCSNFDRGCSEFPGNLERLMEHETNCKFREIYCPYSRHTIRFNEVVSHQCRPAVKLGSEFRLPIFQVESKRGCITFEYKTPCEKTFWAIGEVQETIFTLNVFFYGSPEEAKDFSYRISLGKANEKLYSVKGPVQTLDTRDDLVKSPFAITIKLLRQLSAEGHRFSIKIINHALLRIKESLKDMRSFEHEFD